MLLFEQGPLCSAPPHRASVLPVSLLSLSWAVRANEAHRHMGQGEGAARQLLPMGHQPGGPLESQLCTLEQGDLRRVIQPQSFSFLLQKMGKIMAPNP